MWNTAIRYRKPAVAAALGLVASGVLLIAIGEFLDWGWTRLVGAGIISMSAVAAGTLVGWSDPSRPRIAHVFVSWKGIAVALLAVIIVAPMFAGLVSILGGVILSGTGVEWYLLLSGVFIILFLLVVSLITVAAGLVNVVDGLNNSLPGDATQSNGRDDQ
jgi:hypothetical protein